MRIHLEVGTVLFLCSSALFGQGVEQDRVIRLPRPDPQQNLTEAVVLIRTMAEIREISVDVAQGSVSVRTTPPKIAMAEWLLENLTEPGRNAKHEYRPAPNVDDLVRIFFVKRDMPADMNQIAVIVRTVLAIPKLFVYPPTRALAVRGTQEQMALTEWLIGKLDGPVASRPDKIDELLLKTSDDSLLRVFYMPETTSPARLNEMGVQIRASTKSQRLFAYPRLRAIVMRGDTSQVNAAEQMVKAMMN